MSRDFYMRQLWDGKGSALVELMDPRAMTMYAKLCGHALAKAHARSGDAIAIASYLGSGDSFDRALASFAEAYADQNERDYAALRRPRRPGGSRSRQDSDGPALLAVTTADVRPHAVSREVYGTITVTSVLIVSDGWGTVSLLDAIVVIAGPVIAMYVGHCFAATLAGQVARGRPLTRRELLATARAESGFLLLALPPLVVLVVLTTVGAG